MCIVTPPLDTYVERFGPVVREFYSLECEVVTAFVLEGNIPKARYCAIRAAWRRDAMLTLAKLDTFIAATTELRGARS